MYITDTSGPQTDLAADRPLIPAQRRPHDLGWPDPRAAKALWSRLALARSEYDPRVLAEAEDAVYHFYLCLAHRIAHDQPGHDGPDHDRACAELGLAKAILTGTLPDEASFEEYARRAIQAELRCHHQREVPTNPLLVRARHARQ